MIKEDFRRMSKKRRSFMKFFMKLIRLTFFLAVLAIIGYGTFNYAKLRLLGNIKDTIKTKYL